MGNREDTIKKRLSDQLALERHILEAVERQRGEDSLRENLEANKVVIEIEQVLKSHVATLETLADEYGAGTSSLLKKAVTELAGVAAGLYDKVRDQEVSRMIRDDYTALSLAAMGVHGVSHLRTGHTGAANRRRRPFAFERPHATPGQD